MKSIFGVLFSILLIICFIPVKSYSQSFEGEIVMKITNKDQDKPQTIDYYCKGNKIRFESKAKDDENEGGAMILDTKDYNSIILIPSQKMYMSYSYKNMFGAGSDSLKNKIQTEMDKGNIKITGKTKDINGFSCEQWTFKADDGTSGEAWMTKGIRNFFFFSNPMRPGNEPDWQKKLTNEGYFPMEVTTNDKDGNLESKMEVTSIEKKSLDESLFNPPSDYKKFDMPLMHHDN
jgi:Domain of unknown function (DUF4412)